MSENTEFAKFQRQVALLEEEKAELVKRVKDLSLQGKEKTDLIRSLFDYLPNGVVMFNEDHQVIQINQAAADILCRDKRMLIGKSCSDLFSCYEKNNSCPVLSQDESLESVRTNCHCCDHVLLRSAVLSMMDGSRVVVESLVDVSELEQATREKILALQTKSNFLANFSHELRTPMHGIIGFSNLLMLKKDELSEDLVSYVETLDKSASRLWQLIEKLFEASNLEENSVRLQLSTFSLSEFLTELENSFKLHHNNYQNKVVFECKADDCHLITDKMRLLQILMSLLENASKYTNGGLIECIADVVEENGKLLLKVDVKDNGIGVAENSQQKIFNLFEQEDETSKRAYQGTGLGLAIAKQLAVLMGGGIVLESEQGKGSVFTLTVPVDVLDKPA